MARRELGGRTRIVLFLGAVQALGGALLPSPPLLAQACDAPWPATAAPPLSPPVCAAGRFVLNASEAGATAVALRWPAVPGASAYTVSWGYAPLAPAPVRLSLGMPPERTASVGLPRAPRLLGRSALDRVAGPFALTELTIAGLDAGSSYRWVVHALGADGIPVAESETVALTLRTVPSHQLTATGDANGVTLRWSPVPEAETYRLLAASGQGPLVPDPERADLTATDTRVNHLPPGDYRFQVEARDGAGGYLTRSNVAQASVGATTPGRGDTQPDQWPSAASSTDTATFPLTLRQKGPQAVELSWPTLWGAGSFAVYQAQGASPLAFAFATGMHSTTLTGLAPGVDYTLQVRARNAADVEYATSNSVTVRPEP